MPSSDLDATSSGDHRDMGVSVVQSTPSTFARRAIAAGAGALLLAGASIPAASALSTGKPGPGPVPPAPPGSTAPRDLGLEVLGDQDGWASYHGATVPNGVPAEASGTTGGAAAQPGEVHVVDSWTELRDALAGKPGGSQTDARTNTVPRIIYVNGTIDAFTAADGTTLTCDDFASHVTVTDTGQPFSMDDYIAHFDPAGEWGWTDPSGPLEDARKAAADIQGRQTLQHVGSNVTIVGVGDDARVVGASLRIRDAANVIVRNLTVSDARDCFPAWDPGDTGSGNWNSLYDNISVWTSYSVWVDHNTFDDGDHPAASLPTVYGRPFEIHDGMLDITHGSDLVTVSYNRFEEHDKTDLVGSSDSRTQDRGQHRVTYHHNHWIDIGQRAPRVRYGDVHVYNDYYEQTKEGLFQYYWGAGLESSIYAENNAFTLADGVDAGRIIAGWGGTELYETGSLVNGRPVDLVAAYNATAGTPLTRTARWTPSDFYTYELIPAADVAAVVEASAGAGILPSGSTAATRAPGRVDLTHRGAPGAPDDSDYSVRVRVSGRDLGTVVRLYENGQLADAQWLTGRRHQEATVSITGKAPGTYVYRAEVLNPYGITSSRELTVTVRR